MRQRGFSATTVDDICLEAGVTKGGFFHYFKSNDDLAAAAVVRFHELKAAEFAQAPFRQLADPSLVLIAGEGAFSVPTLRIELARFA